MCPNLAGGLRCQCCLHGGNLLGEEERGFHLQESGNRENLIGVPQRNISLVSISNLFCKKKIAETSSKIAEIFSTQEPGAESVPSWFPAETATCGAPAPFYSCDKRQCGTSPAKMWCPPGPPGIPAQEFTTGGAHSSVSSFPIPSMTFIPKDVKIHQGRWEFTTLQWGQILAMEEGALLPMNRD